MIQFRDGSPVRRLRSVLFVKLIDEDDERLCITDVACRGYDCANGGCAVYDGANLSCLVIVLTPETVRESPHLFPPTCAYIRIKQGQDFPTGTRCATQATGPDAGGGRVYRGEGCVGNRCGRRELEDRIRPWFSDCPAVLPGSVAPRGT